ncbi:EAL domain-containing protein [Dyella sp.]|uniref:EAL domain-containing protein n=1 Tax=Dyella sp. TaxID=1869338 RepID=UPI002D79E470|nr:EAL domain-containing protein [Dyella sp.]HET6431400.1 EAL domain-containing protein [Dyella sp.]
MTKPLVRDPTPLPAPVSPVAWLERLLEASSPAAVAAVVVDMVEVAPTCRSATVLWWLPGTRMPETRPTRPLRAAELALVNRALDTDTPQVELSLALLACRLCHPASAVLLVELDGPAVAQFAPDRHLPLPLLQLAGRQLQRTLELSDLQRSHDQLERSQTLQRALLSISDLSGSDRDMPEMLRGIHAIVCTLMYAENFFIVRHDPARGAMRFLYYADTRDDDGPGDTELPAMRWHGTLTWHVLTRGQPLMGTPQELDAQLDGSYRMVGPSSLDWLGVPMMRDGEAHGALVVQTYAEGIRYSAEDRALLQYVGSHILTALERKQGKDDLEQRVRERTLELADLNRGLQQEVAERQRAERLQAALFQIAQLATADIDQHTFYRQVHAIVGGLISARNFFIGLVDEARGALSFPYAVDITGEAYTDRPLGGGLSEYVLTRGPLVVDRATMDAMIRRGDIDAHSTGTPSICWLGVPLRDGQRAIGLVAVQSYTDQVTYGEAEQELLGFVASQIATSLQRRRVSDALQHAYAQLEQRVHERTRALRKEIAERERAQQQLRHQVMHDPLTGLPNRDHLRERIEHALAAARSEPARRCALLYIDVDRFKVINDSLGHLAGDQVLKEVARRLQSCVREPDVVARLSGDEFAILLSEVEDATSACRVAERVLAALGQPLPVSGRELQPSASLGIALGERHYAHADELLRDADIALYRAKELGRKRYEMFDDALASNLVDELGMENELRHALQHDEFQPYLQPICRLDSGERVGYEALLRWHHPERGLLTPGAFVKVAQDCGQIEAIDWQLFERACVALVKLPDREGFLTFNVSALHLRHADFDQRLLAMVARTGLAPSRVIVEVTEGSLLDDPDQVRATLERLRQAGVGAALDDFGTGYSSLNYLHSLPLRLLKIDQSFVHAMDGGNTNSSTVVEAILALAHALEIQVIAEGIETPAQRELLRGMGCEMGQGYLLGRPHPPTHWDDGRR